MKIGIVGHGFVGKAVEYGFTHPKVKLQIIDPKYNTTVGDLESCQVVFVCVPTPMSDTGKINSTILRDVMEFFERNYESFPLVVIKSTITPDIADMYERPGVVYNPEFLREKSAADDFVNPEFHIFGGYDEDLVKLEEIYKQYSLCKPCPTYMMTAKEASYVKYTINSYLALKVVFFNQLYDTISSDDSNFNVVINAVCADSRIGYSHTRVPGFDGKQGFGGSCFPKDTSAFTHFTDKMTLLEKAVDINNTYRSRYELDQREKEQNITYKTVD